MGAPGATPPSGRPTSVADLIARLTAMDRRLPVTDGVAWFVKLYLKMTEAIQAAVVGAEFAAPEAVERLAVIFGGLFFHVDDADGRERRAPKAWAPLVEARADERIAPIQFAVAGANAHINRDLPVALVATWRELALGPGRDTPFRRDFEAVNPIVIRVEQEVKRWFETGFEEYLRHAFHGVDDEIASWSLQSAREAAWDNAELLWNLRDAPEIGDLFVATLDRF